MFNWLRTFFPLPPPAPPRPELASGKEYLEWVMRYSPSRHARCAAATALERMEEREQLRKTIREEVQAQIHIIGPPIQLSAARICMLDAWGIRYAQAEGYLTKEQADVLVVEYRNRERRRKHGTKNSR